MKPVVSAYPCLASPSCLPLSFLSPPLPLPLPSPPSLRAMSGRSRAEGQKRKFILPEPPALFHMVHWLCVRLCTKKSVLTGACKAGEQDREAGRKKKRRKKGGGEGVQTERRKCREVEEGRSTEGARLHPYENVFIWPMTDRRCCQPGLGSHCLTVTEA